jgi:hypothetical protein
MKRFTQPWRPCRSFGIQPVGNAACSPRPEVVIADPVTTAPSPRWTFRGKGGATMPTCRPADLPFGAWMTDGGTRPALSMPAWAQAFPPSSTPRWRISPQAPPPATVQTSPQVSSLAFTYHPSRHPSPPEIARNWIGSPQASPLGHACPPTAQQLFERHLRCFGRGPIVKKYQY